jgi:hypothetical protein
MSLSVADIESADDFVRQQPINHVVERASRVPLNGILANHGTLGSASGDEKAAALAAFYLTSLAPGAWHRATTLMWSCTWFVANSTNWSDGFRVVRVEDVPVASRGP